MKRKAPSYFLAYYEDAAKVEAAAIKRGFEPGGDSGSWHDFVECEDDKFRTAKKFTTFDAALAWLLPEIAAVKSVYGQGTITECVDVPRADRCRYCVCQGQREIKEWIVSNEVDDERTCDSLCADED